MLVFSNEWKLMPFIYLDMRVVSQPSTTSLTWNSPVIPPRLKVSWPTSHWKSREELPMTSPRRARRSSVSFVDTICISGSAICGSILDRRQRRQGGLREGFSHFACRGEDRSTLLRQEGRGCSTLVERRAQGIPRLHMRLLVRECHFVMQI